MDSYEQWTRAEIARLRAEALKANADADVLRQAFDKWLESQGRKSESKQRVKIEENHGANGHAPARRAKRPAYGDKNLTGLQKIKEASPVGLTTDELYDAFVEIYGPKYKRSSLRALLWNQKNLGNVVNNGGRYVIAPKGAARVNAQDSTGSPKGESRG
jgi:hypothetical protein